MWILVRLFLLVAFAAYRLFAPTILKGENRSGRTGLPYRIQFLKTKKGIRETKVALEVRSLDSFKLVPENSFLRFLKKIGWGVEFQAGAPDFDDTFYVASDDPNFLRKLRIHSDLRQAFLDLANRGWARIRCDKRQVIIQKTGAAELDEVAENALALIKTILDSMTADPDARDPYLGRIIAIELILWGGFGYLTGAFAQLSIDHSTTLIEPLSLFLAGLGAGAIALIAWLILLFMFTRKSSRAPLLISESVLGFVLCLLLLGPQSAVDLNIALDRSPPTKYELVLENKEIRTTGTGRHRTTHYYFYLQGKLPDHLSSRIDVSHTDYWRFAPPQELTMIVHEGAFGARYISELKPGNPVDLQRLELSKAAPEADVQSAIEAISWKPREPAQGFIQWREEKWAGGQVRSREPFVNGKQNGEGVYFHANGQPYSRILWVDGKKQGRYVLHREDGSLEGDYHMKDGQPHGWMRWYDEKGRLFQEEIYFEGRPLPLTKEQKSKLPS